LLVGVGIPLPVNFAQSIRFMWFKFGLPLGL
jgi:hypothetical protein